MNRFLLLSTVYLFALSACTVGPDFKAPEAQTPQNYVATDEAVTHEQKVELGNQIARDWWTLFDSKPLNDSIQDALAHNYDIAAARETQAQAEEAVNAATGGLLPQVGLDANVTRQKYGVALFGPSNFTIPPFTAYEVGPSISWTLDLFGSQRREVERQQALAEYQTHQLDAAYVTLTGNVVAQSLTIAATNAEIDATKHIIAEDEKTLKLVDATFKAGTGTKVEILTAQSQLQNTQTLIPPLEQRISIARHTLAILQGKNPTDYIPPIVTLTDFTLPKTLPVTLPSELVHSRPDILAAEANLHAASAAVGVATANLYPKLTLSANTTQQALSAGDLFQGANSAWAVTAGLTAPLYSGGTLSAEKRAAEHAYQVALAQYQKTILIAFGQVSDSLQALAHDEQEIAIQQKAVESARNLFALSRKSYRAGNTGLLQIQESQRQLSQAEIGLIRAQSRRYLDTAQLFVALAGSPVQHNANNNANETAEK